MCGQSVVDGIDELGGPGATAMAAKCGQNEFDEIDRPSQRARVCESAPPTDDTVAVGRAEKRDAWKRSRLSERVQRTCVAKGALDRTTFTQSGN
mmetsp:Transcript_22261/g.32521  ORF Transcript_22261/g.32521 Transcript_22261/m.32521 type:complete len:94 (+) Transcript_22261:163-444(+)